MWRMKRDGRRNSRKLQHEERVVSCITRRDALNVSFLFTSLADGGRNGRK